MSARMVTGAVIWMDDGSVWGPIDDHPCRLATWPAFIGGRALTFAEIRRLEARRSELEQERRALRARERAA